MTIRVFVYGSLKRGFRHHDQMRRARFVEVSTLPGFALFRVGAYPAAVPCPGARVEGEVFEVSAADLQLLDEFEGCPELYQRVRARLAGGLGGRHAWVYTMPPTAVRGAERLSGDRWSE